MAILWNNVVRKIQLNSHYVDQYWNITSLEDKSRLDEFLYLLTSFLYRLILDLIVALATALDDGCVKNTLTPLINSDDWPGYILIKTTEAFSESSVQLQLQLYILYAGYGPGNYLSKCYAL